VDSAQQLTSGSGAPTSELRALTAAVARQLGERPYAFRLIHRLLELYGEPFVREHVDRAPANDAAWGMPVKDGARRRTLGGVFFHLTKQTVGLREWRRRVDPAWRPPAARRLDRAGGALETAAPLLLPRVPRRVPRRSPSPEKRAP
jgi:PHAX RNA-binding domain